MQREGEVGGKSARGEVDPRLAEARSRQAILRTAHAPLRRWAGPLAAGRSRGRSRSSPGRARRRAGRPSPSDPAGSRSRLDSASTVSSAIARASARRIRCQASSGRRQIASSSLNAANTIDGGVDRAGAVAAEVGDGCLGERLEDARIVDPEPPVPGGDGSLGVEAERFVDHLGAQSVIPECLLGPRVPRLSRRGHLAQAAPRSGAQTVGPAARRSIEDPDAVDRLEAGGGQDLGRRALGGEAAVVQQRDRGGAGEGVVGVVGREHDAVALGGERPDLAQHQRLVAEVEAGGRLVHHDQRAPPGRARGRSARAGAGRR